MAHEGTKLNAARAFECSAAEKISAGDRPSFHLTPLTGWMNDPNGFCWYNGCYHLFYQYYPYDTVWGPMHWGHATSTDLLHWQYQPCTLAPDTIPDGMGCFSGSSLPLPDGRLLLMYTGVTADPQGGKNLQVQCVASGDGIDFVKEENNPVIPRTLLPEGYSAVDFRDPKIWYEGGSYYCAVASRHTENLGSVLLFESLDALHWKFVTVLDSSRGQLGRMWECPDFFALGNTQVLLVSPQEVQATADGEFHCGDNTAALLGSYDRTTHVFTRRSVQAVDQGLDFYAPQTTLAPDGRRILVGWMQSWATTPTAPRRHTWFGRMSLPRELAVHNGRLCQQPVREIETLWADEIRLEGVTVAAPTGLPGIGGRSLDLTVTVDVAASPDCRCFALRFAEGGGRFVEVRCDLAKGSLTFDRSCGGCRRDIPHIRTLPAVPREGRLTLRLILDLDCAELFLNGGERTVSALLEAPAQAAGISFRAEGGPVRLTVVQHTLR
ncbi:glycoside hydrolase family 32 protein [uncultured Gemmiger sp.]|uniref:glycoside hydrolase family 32 protein n=1 Tax=uncultured Gemmiger sp. TaxID=1623490 RepID=UPI0025DF9FBB|nr:glycoside hydrolase family 32 protein [uncultured Gemmiger sp.]